MTPRILIHRDRKSDGLNPRFSRREKEGKVAVNFAFPIFYAVIDLLSPPDLTMLLILLIVAAYLLAIYGLLHLAKRALKLLPPSRDAG